MSSSGIRIKMEKDETGVDLDIARDRFDAALQGLLQKDDESDSENESDSEKPKVIAKVAVSGSGTRNARPPRKRRRKEIDLRDSGFHHTFVMRMFDRSVDLAQFDETSPLYPICRAWMINQPHNSSLNVKQEPGSPSGEGVTSTESSQEEDGEVGGDSQSNGGVTAGQPVYKLPSPRSWPSSSLHNDPRIPIPLSHPVNRLIAINDCEHTPPGLLMTEHLKRWRQIRQLWRSTARVNDQRYNSSYTILKAMFDRAHEG